MAWGADGNTIAYGRKGDITKQREIRPLEHGFDLGSLRPVTGDALNQLNLKEFHCHVWERDADLNSESTETPPLPARV